MREHPKDASGGGFKLTLEEAMSNTYDDFVQAVDTELLAHGKEPLSEADQSTVVHCFGFGRSVKDTVWNVTVGRKTRRWYTEEDKT